MTSAIYNKNIALHNSRNKYHALHFKVKNAVTELSSLTMIVPIFTKGAISKGFPFTSRLLHPAINLSIM